MRKKFIIIIFIIMVVLISVIFVNKKSEKLMVSVQTNENQVDSMKYKNPIVPEGFSKVETENASWDLDENGYVKGWNDGLVIEDDKGNQFVWVPCSIKESDEVPTFSRYYNKKFNGKDEDYLPVGEEKLEHSKNGETGFVYYFQDNNPINDEIKKNVEQYGGFYIGRYETGIENGNFRTSSNTQGEKNWTGWENGNPVIKPNTQVWNYVTGDKALELSQEIINNEYCKTYLMTSYCYDTVIKWLRNSSNNFFLDEMKKDDFKKFVEDYDKQLFTTGSNEQWTINNISNILDNVGELSTEKYIAENYTSYVFRRGQGYTRINFTYMNFLEYGLIRHFSTDECAVSKIWGFRAILIIK